MAKDKGHELQEFLPTEEEEVRQDDAIGGQSDGCETQEEHIEIQPAEEEGDDSSNEHAVAIRGESRGRRWLSSCLRRFRCDAQKTRKRKDNDEVLYERILEDNLMQTIHEGRIYYIKKLLTPKTLKTCDSNTLLLSMKVSYQLHKLADAKGPDAVRFERLANSVEEFTYCLLDGLKIDPVWCKYFGDRCLNDFIDDAIGYEQKKLVTHTAVHNEMNRKWRGREFMKSKWKSWQLTFFNIWCLFDLVLSPILLAVFSLMRNKVKGACERKRTEEEEEEEEEKEGNQPVAQLYLYYLESPYYKFVRDTLSYIILLLLHYALCLSPSTIAFSGLEWSILVFFIGRYMVELRQIWSIKEWLTQSREIKNDGAPSRCLKIFSRYLSDSWNKLDFVSLVIYFIILVLRIVTWVIAGSVTNNRALVVAGYLYSFNTFCLTIRAFGHVMEQSKEVGTIQIALFTILKDIRTIVWQFMAVIVAFSMAITKIYMSEKSFVANGSDRHETACKESGLSCWWAIVLHLGWSLLDQSGESDPLASVDLTSVTLARILYAAFLIMGVILLVNMLIALLSNTYQKTEDNSIREWSFKRAVTIQTYDGYDPIPVPLNIIYRIVITLLRLCKKDNSELRDRKYISEKKKSRSEDLKHLTRYLEDEYVKKHGAIFPVTDDIEIKVDDLQMKLNLVLREIEERRQMMSQILRTTFQFQTGDQGQLCTGQTAWNCHPGIRIEGPLLTIECKTYIWQGARYHSHFSPEFPHFEVIIIETGKNSELGIGIVNEGYDTTVMPGCYKESVGYHTDSGKIFHNNKYQGKETVGPKARRGDRIRCTVMFEEKQVKRNGKVQVPIFFTLNGKKIMVRDGQRSHFYMDCDNPLFPFICMTEGGQSVLAKMCAKEDDENHSPQLQETKTDPIDVAPSETGALKENSPELEVKADLVDVGKHLTCATEDVVPQSLHIQDVKSDLAAVRLDMCTKEDLEKVKEATRRLEEKLDALMARLGGKE